MKEKERWADVPGGWPSPSGSINRHLPYFRLPCGVREADGEGSTFEREHILLTSGDIGRIECVQRGTSQGAIRAREFSRDPGALQLAYLVNRRPTTIEWGHCDPSGALFNSRYFEFSDWSTALLFQAATGMSKSELMAKYGANMPLVDVRGRFVQG